MVDCLASDHCRHRNRSSMTDAACAVDLAPGKAKTCECGLG